MPVVFTSGAQASPTVREQGAMNAPPALFFWHSWCVIAAFDPHSHYAMTYEEFQNASIQNKPHLTDQSTTGKLPSRFLRITLGGTLILYIGVTSGDPLYDSALYGHDILL